MEIYAGKELERIRLREARKIIRIRDIKEPLINYSIPLACRATVDQGRIPAVMFVTLQREPTRSYGRSEGPCGRSLKRTSASFQSLSRTRAINCGLRLAEVRFRQRRDIE